VTLISNILANKAFSYSLTLIDTTKLTLVEDYLLDPFSYTSSASSRYTSNVFLGIIVDIGVSTKSIASYS